MIKALVKYLIRASARNDYIWPLLDATVMSAARYADFERQQREHGRAVSVSQAIQEHCPDLVVRHGPFQGLQYPHALSVGSALFPKLLGCYELEIQPLISELCTRQYAEIIDVGCAEGYYAVGMARRVAGARVFAYDVDPLARAECQSMAKLNGVEERVTVSGFCDAATLLAFQFSGRGLIISDCEGYETELFTESVAKHLANHDVLVEVHDFVNPDASRLLRSRFGDTHDISVFRSIDDFEKARTYQFSEIAGYDVMARKSLVAEYRPCCMEWYFFTPRRV